MPGILLGYFLKTGGGYGQMNIWSVQSRTSKAPASREQVKRPLRVERVREVIYDSTSPPRFPAKDAYEMGRRGIKELNKDLVPQKTVESGDPEE